MARKQFFSVGEFTLEGTYNGTVTVLTYDPNGKILLCSGTSVPSATAGYAKSCLFIKTDAGAGTQGLYENTGTTASCTFNLIGSIASADIAANAITPIKMGTRTLVALTDGAATPTIAQLMTSSIFTMTPGAARTFTTPTAALMVAGVTGATIGSWFDFTIVNLSATTNAYGVTLTAGDAGVTLVGSPVVYSGSGTFRAVLTNVTGLSEALSIYRIDDAVSSALTGVTAGTQAAGKAVIANSDTNIGIAKVTELHIGSTGAETQVTATAAELNYNDITTLGTGAASKSVVLDASGNYIMPSAGIFGLSRVVLPAAGSTAADAAVITQQVTAVTGSNGTLAVALPAAATTTGPLLVINTVVTAGATLPVFPVNGGNDNINALAEDAAFTMLPGEAAWFIPTSATQWYVERINLLSLGTTSVAGKVLLSDGANPVAFATVLTDSQSADIAIHIPDPGAMVDAYVALSTAALTAAQVDILATLTATAAEINTACDQSAQVLAAGAGFAGAGTVYKTSITKQGDIFKTTILIDLTGTASSTTDLDIIGTSGVSHIGQITAAKCGTLFFGQITCLETPAGGDVDIDLYSATEGTGAFDGLVTDLAEVAMLTKGGNWAAAAATQIALTTLPAADKYMYLTAGAGSVPGTYTAGQFLIELWGV